MGAPVLIGAGVGALGSTLMGGSPFKGALMGGGLGAGYGGLQSMINGGSFMSGAFPSLASSAGGTGIQLAPAVADGTLSLVPVASNVGTGIQLSQVPIYGSGAGFGITDLANYATGTGTNLVNPTKSLLSEISPYLSANNVIGGANVASNFMQRRPIPQAPAGGVSRGSPPPAEAVQQLIAQVQAQQPRRRLSLLVG